MVRLYNLSPKYRAYFASECCYLMCTSNLTIASLQSQENYLGRCSVVVMAGTLIHFHVMAWVKHEINFHMKVTRPIMRKLFMVF